MRPFATVTTAVLAAVALSPALAMSASAAGSPIGGPLMGDPGVSVDYTGGAGKLPTVHASSWVVADATTGEVLAAKAPHRRLRPASTLKTLTAVTLLPRLSPTATYVTVDGDVNVEGSRAGLVPNAPYTIDDLFYGMFLPSGNDAATALARAAGSVKGTVDLMRAEAHYLNADDTRVVNPTGLDAPHQFSSAYDLALILRAGIARPDFTRYIGTLQHPLPGNLPKKGHKRSTFQLWNQDKLLQQGYPGLIGGKTGYTTLAGRTFVAAAQRNGHTLIVTLMGIKDPSDQAARALLDWGFHNDGKAKPVGLLVAAGAPVVVSATSPSPSPSEVSPSSSTSPSTVVTSVSQGAHRGGTRGLLVWVGGGLVLIGGGVAARPFMTRRNKGTERDRLLAAARRWES